MKRKRHSSQAKGYFSYSKMPLGLKNAEATYQRLVDKAFHKQIGRNLKVYVDDLVIKSRTEHEMIRDIEETVKTLREINMKLNPKKCTFGIEEGMFLRYKVNTEGIKVCPNKMEVVLSLSSPKCLKDVHKLNGKLASLNRFLSKSAEKSLPFFKTLKKCTKKSDFQWIAKAEAAFKEMKKMIAELPTLTAPSEKEELIVYLAATREAYIPRTSVKGQILADFIVERPEDDPLDTPIKAEEELPDPWTLFDETNNEAEYKALIAGLRIAEQMGIKNLQANVDSRLVANQVHRSENKKADALSKIASTNFSYLTKQFLVEKLNEKSINEAEVLAVVEEEGDTWMTPIYNYLTEETLLAEKERARSVRRKSRRYAIINGVLYKKTYLGLWLRCVGPLQANYVLREIHEVSCSMHARTRSVVAKAIRARYYWPTMRADTRNLIRECQDFYVHRLVPRNLQQKLTPIMSPWPFYKWGIDIVGTFPEGPGKFKFLIVAMD
ncbi:reverse transcriptase domain-containing protein [Tanacetum coccineum]